MFKTGRLKILLGGVLNDLNEKNGNWVSNFLCVSNLSDTNLTFKKVDSCSKYKHFFSDYMSRLF